MKSNSISRFKRNYRFKAQQRKKVRFHLLDTCFKLCFNNFFQSDKKSQKKKIKKKKIKKKKKKKKKEKKKNEKNEKTKKMINAY